MAGPSRPSFSAPSEPSLRRLGVGGSGGGGERPLRAQLVVALIVGLVLLAVPLYLWRRPSGTENAPSDAAAANLDATASLDAASGALLEGGAADERVKLASVQRVKCSAGPGARGQEGNLCDQLSIFEHALAKAIKESVDCAPKSSKEGSINYVLSVDFAKKSLHVFPGASGSWRGPQARKAAKCVLGNLPPPPWASIQHQYRFYQIAIMASYGSAASPVKPPGPAGTSVPLFE
jgi:hypothetical protein